MSMHIKGTRRRRGLAGFLRWAQQRAEVEATQFPVGYLAARAAPPPRLADGAEFHGRVDSVDDGRFRASCWAELHHRDGASLEEPEISFSYTQEHARAWIERRRAERLFPLVLWDD